MKLQVALQIEWEDSAEDTVTVTPGLQRSQSSPQKKQELVSCRRTDLYVLVALLAVRGAEKKQTSRYYINQDMKRSV